MMELIEIKTDSFTAIMPTLRSMPLSKLLAPIMVHDNEIALCFALLNTMRDNLSEDKWHEFDALSSEETIIALQKWLETK